MEYDNELTKRYHQYYLQWKKSIDENLTFLSKDEPYIHSQYYQSMIALGQPAIPLMIESLHNNDGVSHFLIHALQELTQYRFNAKEIAAAELLFGQPLGNQTMAYLWIGWWRKKTQTKGN